MTEIKLEDIKLLDFILNKLVNEDTVVTSNDLNSFAESNSPQFSELKFESLMYILKEYEICKCQITSDTNCVFANDKTAFFVEQGGFKNLYEKQQKDNKYNEIVRSKERYEGKLYKWQYYTFWPLFAIAVLGGIYAANDFKNSQANEETIKKNSESILKMESELSKLRTLILSQKKDTLLTRTNSYKGK